MIYFRDGWTSEIAILVLQVSGRETRYNGIYEISEKKKSSDRDLRYDELWARI